MSGPVTAYATTVPSAATFARAYPGTAGQAHLVRSDLAEFAGDFPVVAEPVLLAAELATNAVPYMRSGDPDQTFTVRATIPPGTSASVEVIDQGGAWDTDTRDDEHGRAWSSWQRSRGAGNRGVDDDEQSRVAWFRLGWPQSRTGWMRLLHFDVDHELLTVRTSERRIGTDSRHSA
jgi:anti-sigma regulatory factor (Ser/Thr protein kinase)